MNKKSRDIIAIILGILQKLGPVMMVTAFIWMLGLAGASDFEAEFGEILHPFSWYVTNGLKAIALMVTGACCYEYAYPVYRAIRKANRKYIVKCYREITEERIHNHA